MTSIMRAVNIPSIYVFDYTWSESRLFVWTAAELGTTIIAASIPVLRVLLRNMVDSTQRKTGEGLTNTFRTGTYMCSTVGRSQSYRRMDTERASQKVKRGNSFGGISEDGESMNSLSVAPVRSLDHGGILKTEEIQVQYDNSPTRPGNAALGFELEDVPPVDSGLKSR